MDILKCGGYKLSALEIEGHLLDHPGIAECAVVGVPDEAYGQVVAAVLVGRDGKPPPTLPELRQWARDVMAPYKARGGRLEGGGWSVVGLWWGRRERARRCPGKCFRGCSFGAAACAPLVM